MTHEFCRGLQTILNIFILDLPGEEYSWAENYAWSSALEPQPAVWIDNLKGNSTCVSQLELDRDVRRTFCPLLTNPSTYIPDTVDLTTDHEAR